jgi:hypothetical protein
MSVLDRLPAWCTTGVGSLPFESGRRAAAHAARAYDLPFCPQLPAVEGDMVAEWLGADPRGCGWSPDRDRTRPAAWEALLAELAHRPRTHGVVKLQVTGPLTLAIALARKPRELLPLAGEIAAWLAANAAGQSAALAERGLSAVVVVDEPALARVAAGRADGIERAWDPLRAAGAAWGLHLCCTVPWAIVDRAEPDLLSFDLAVESVTRPAAAVLGRLVDRGGRVAWGVLSPHLADDTAVAERRLRTALAIADVPGECSLLTAGCGTGRVSVGREQAIADTLRGVGGRLRRAPSEVAG